MNMIERVAKALHDLNRKQAVWENMGKVYKSPFIRQAKAAITAMREPTDEMINGALAQTRNPRKVWQEMIDEALKE